VPDLATKPTSVLTVEPIQDRCRVVATLSEPLPLRIWFDEDSIVSWLYTQLAGSVLDAIEAEAIGSPTGTGPGSGSGEHMTGILKVSGTTAVPFSTDVPTTLRSAITAMQNLGEIATGWVLNPADAEAIDLLRWGASGGLLTEGYLAGNAPGDGTSNNIFGSYPRIVSPNVPAGTAILADWTQLKLYYREMMRIDVDGSGPLFDTNAVKIRAESRVGVGILRPQAFTVVDLTA
jgi:HK97 family phage major capsid protein